MSINLDVGFFGTVVEILMVVDTLGGYYPLHWVGNIVATLGG